MRICNRKSGKKSGLRGKTMQAAVLHDRYSRRKPCNTDAGQRVYCQDDQEASDQSLPPVAQSSRLTSCRMISTDSGLEPSVATVASVMALTNARFCSTVRPSKSWTLMVGMLISF